MAGPKDPGVWAPHAAAAAAKLLQLRLTLCDLTDSTRSPPGSSIPGILQARILEWAAISFSNACMHAKSLQLCLTVRPYGQQPTRLLLPQESLGKSTGVGCHCLLRAKLDLREPSFSVELSEWVAFANLFP